MTAPLSAIADHAAKGLRATSNYYAGDMLAADAKAAMKVAHEALREISVACRIEAETARVEADTVAKLSRALLGRDADGNVVRNMTEAPK